MDFAVALGRLAHFREWKCPALLSGAHAAPSQVLAAGLEWPAEPEAFAIIVAVAMIVAAQEVPSASAQIIARARMKVQRRKSRPAQPSAIEFACTSPTFSNENLFLSPCDLIACYCCGAKFRTAAAACRRM
jgi:hypothetical protein